MAEKYENEEHCLQIKQTMKDLFKPFQEMLDKKRWDTAKQSKIDRFFQKKGKVFGKFCQNRHGKTKKNLELGVLTSGIKRDGHQKKTGN